jgi:hypothetical protein
MVVKRDFQLSFLQMRITAVAYKSVTMRDTLRQGAVAWKRVAAPIHTR